MTLEDLGRQLLPDHIQAQMSPEEMVAFVFALAKVHQDVSELSLTHRNPYDDMMDVSVRFRMALEKEGEKAAYFERGLRLVAVAARWSKTGLPTADQGRIKRFVDLMNDLIAKNPRPLAGADPIQREQSFRRAVMHIESLWKDAVTLYRSSSYPRSCFLAITCLEEAGKLVPGRMILKAESIYGALSEPPPKKTKGKNPLYEHEGKWFLAAAGGILLNARLSAKLGTDKHETILVALEKGTVKVLREGALYAVLAGEQVRLPQDVISRELAAEWIMVAGEVIVETGGYPRAERDRLVALVEAFAV